jgi:prepilin-type N-terminal cleavage/methylation domain-containing protein
MSGSSSCQRRGDSGFTLIEVVVAMGLLLVLSSSVLAILAQSAKTSQTDRRRVAASNLAAREIETVRNAFHRDDYNDAAVGASALAIANAGDVTNPNNLNAAAPAGSPLVLDGTQYTVVRQVNWMPVGSGRSACDGGSAVTYPALAVHVEVTWPQMNGVRPVVSDTVLTPPKNILASGTAFAAVRVRDRNGAGFPGRTVKLTKGASTYTDTTGPDGCAVFAVSGAGSYVASLAEPGYVGTDGNPTPTVPVEVKSGELQPAELYYDRASGLAVSLTVVGGAPDGGSYALPVGRPGLTLENANLRPDSLRTFAAGTTAVPNLFPWPEGYSVWPGTCTDADPAGSPSNGTRGSKGGGTPAQTDAVTVELRPVKVLVTDPGLAGDANTYTATAVNGGSCSGGDSTLSLGTLTKEGGTKVLRASLPPGTWTVQLMRGSTAVRAGSVVLGQTGQAVIF